MPGGVYELVALPEMVSVWRLVHHIADDAIHCRAAERVVRRFVGKSARRYHVDELGLKEEEGKRGDSSERGQHATAANVVSMPQQRTWSAYHSSERGQHTTMCSQGREALFFIRSS